MKSDPVIVGKSRIQGKGVFAARDIMKGEVVLHRDNSEQLTAEQMNHLPVQEKENYVSFCNGKLTHMSEPERYVNHSCEPNTYVEDCYDVALRNIAKGEEITSDYASDGHTGKKMKCLCGSKNCRELIDV
jgi:uncharacterized protein